MKSKTVIGFILLVLLAAPVGGASGSSQSAAPPAAVVPPQEDTLVISASPHHASALVWIAAEQGFFREQRLKVEIKVYEAGKYAVTDLLAGKLDAALASEMVAAEQILEGASLLRILTSIATLDMNSIVADRARGISRPVDLKGKTVGVTRGTTGEFFLGVFLTFQGLTLEDVQLVNLRPKELQAALAQGRVAAVSTWEPFAEEVKTALGDRGLAWSSQCGQDYYWLLLSAAPTVAGKQPALVRLVRALARAQAFVAQHPGAARGILAARLGWTPAYLGRFWPQGKYALQLNQALVLAMENEAYWLLNHHLAPPQPVPNFLAYMDTSVLAAAKPEAVQIPGLEPGR